MAEDIIGSPAASQDSEMAQSVEDSPMCCTPDNSIGDAINRLTDELAAFCFEQFEEDGNLGDGNNVADMNIDQEAFEEELQVRNLKAIR